MVIAVCRLSLSIPSAASLKDKRSALKPIIARLRRDFNISVAEVERQDDIGSAVLGLVCVSTGSGYAHGLLEKAVGMIDQGHWSAVVDDYSIELA
jgi:uncharacterized protein